jgi:hypothetical protein
MMEVLIKKNNSYFSIFILRKYGFGKDDIDFILEFILKVINNFIFFSKINDKRG